MKFGDNIYYETETDEIVKFRGKKKFIDKNYKYTHNGIFFRLLSTISYRLLATPFAYITFKCLKNIKFINKQILKEAKSKGYFVYANHTNQFCDGFCPALICFPKKPHIIVDSANVSIPFWGKFIAMWGALPLPQDKASTKNFTKAIENTLNDNNPIIVYPETQLWPYYTKIRSFPSSSFRYPVKYNKPAYTFTTVYKLNKKNKKPKIEIYVDGPFLPDSALNQKEAQKKLRDEVFETMRRRASLSDYEYVNYIKKGDV